MNKFINQYPYIVGIFSIIIGLLIIIYTKKRPQKKHSVLAADFRGFIGGSLLILMGILIILRA
jgi:hypothetical protein